MTLTEALKCQQHLYRSLKQDTFVRQFTPSPIHIAYLKSVLLLLCHLLLEFSSELFP
jgi:hypothetical protein